MIHVVTVNYNSHEDLLLCIDSLGSDAAVNFLVVDNASPSLFGKAGQDFAKAVHSRGAQLICNNTNVGFGAAINIGLQELEAAPDDVIVILNPDCIASTGALVALAEGLSTFDLVSPKITWREGSSLWFAGGYIDIARGITRHFVEEFGVNSPPIKTQFLTGACIAAQCQTWRKLGGFREDLFLYWEDVDLCLRAARMGLSRGVVPRSQIWHRVGGSSERTGKSATYYYHMMRNRQIVCRQFGARWAFPFTSGLLETCRFVKRAACEPHQRVRKILSTLRGTIAGLRIHTSNLV